MVWERVQLNYCHVHGKRLKASVRLRERERERERRAAESPGHRERTILDRVQCTCVNRDRIPLNSDCSNTVIVTHTVTVFLLEMYVQVVPSTESLGRAHEETSTGKFADNEVHIIL